ncbi:MAG TPA: hypothetical protein VGX76_00165 [Pirellulales bacterium]|jgi:hypothetical protein|nr:hypothetical protein [Pirellulales bacterium]
MNARPPQFGLKTIFALVTWTAAIAGLAVSQLAGWTMTAIAFSVGALNCRGRLQGWQWGAAQARVFGVGWSLLALSLFLPAVKGCGNVGVPGWEAAAICAQLVVDPPASESSGPWRGALLYAWLTLGNALLLGSPLLLWRLRRERGQFYGTWLAMAVATMCGLSIRDDSRQFLAGYYVWCLAGLSLLCAYRLRWSTLALMGLAVLLVCLT